MRLPVLLALLAAAPQPQLHVLDAVYGNPERGRMCDATLPVAGQCDDRSTCVIAVSNGMCGDPDYGVPKRLFITFKCGRYPAQTVTVGEAAVVRLACDAARPPAPPAPPSGPANPAEGAAFRTPSLP
jgi:hypothetical protein